MKPPVSDQSQQPTSSFKLNAAAIIGQDILRVTLKDALDLENQRRYHVLYKKLNLLFQDAKEEAISQQKESTFYNIFSKYAYNACPDPNCADKTKISLCLHCADCILEKNGVSFLISDQTITYYYPPLPTYMFNIYSDVKDLNKFLSPQPYNMIFRAYPPNIEEFKAILYCHREFVRMSKAPKIKNISGKINYSSPLQIIRYQVAKQLLLRYHAADAFNEDPPKQIIHFQHEQNTVLNNKFQISSNAINPIEEILSKRIDHTNHQVRHDPNDPNTTDIFVKLTRTLKVISGCNPDTIKQLAVMLAKVFIGRPYLKYLDENANHLTLIITNHPKYIEKFLMDIFSYNPAYNKHFPIKRNFRLYEYPLKGIKSYFHATKYSAAMLSEEENIGEFIKDKLMGNIVNIDTSRTSGNHKFKALVEGTAISFSDPYFGKLYYKSNAHYIRINHDVQDSRLGGNIEFDTIICDVGLEPPKYESLDDYELFFLVTGFVNYGIDLLSQPDSTPTIKSLRPTELVDEFIKEFCSDTTSTIPLAFGHPPIKDKVKRLAKAKELGITNLPFIHVNILAECLEKWCAISYNENCDSNRIKSAFIKKYPDLFHLKKKAETPFGNMKDANGLYGLELKLDKYKEFVSTEALSTQSKSLPETFVSYMENVLSTYFLKSTPF